ncbi:MAG: hypothetical protein A2Y15_07955 [Clostridiales bacterium GWF2_36_10]|nr:MAG: hypothetical protein A2Y15_07955 [Clostridiales bacterium GWF2_36_10]HAN20279.1 DNA-binding protein [Clostridiales bacterium]
MDDKRAVICKLIDFYAGVLSTRQREVLELYYYEDFSLAEIAENLGITRQGVRDNIKHGEEALFDFEDKLGLIKKNVFISETAHRIIELTDNEKIKELASEIIVSCS